MEIQLTNIGKRFGRTWIIKDINANFKIGSPSALIGSNGSGKSTLLKIISGGLTPTVGTICFQKSNGKELFWSDAAQLISYAAPYMDLIEYLTLEEHIDFHFKFKKFRSGIDKSVFINKIEMDNHKNKLVKDFSSGMKQRLKLAFALFTDHPIILLDEPTSNLDESWSNWYLKEVSKLIKDTIIVVASNQKSEYEFCPNIIDIKAHLSFVAIS